MRVAVVGLGIQGRKRSAVAGDAVAATVDPVVAGADYTAIEQVPLDRFDAALVCTPDEAKPAVLEYLLSRGKHVLVEKPLLATDEEVLHRLGEIARTNGAALYTAYNHRFEPHIATVKEVLDSGTIGAPHFVKVFYGNGTALDVKRSVWRDRGLGVLSDIGSHLLDMLLFLFGRPERDFEIWSFDAFENRACDHVLFGSRGTPVVELEATLLSWRNTFTLDVYGDLGSAHINCLCKWGPSTLAVRKRVFPSGRPEEEVRTLESADPTWALEHDYFLKLCRTAGTNIENDIWINSVLGGLARTAGVEVP
jgi:scyllo-inositol 2-dehydrogenase (NADP+)